MLITRRLLTPILIWFSLIVLAIIGAGLYSTNTSSQRNETAFLDRQVQVFDAKLSSLKELALTLATEQANDANVQKALSDRDRTKLLDLTYSKYIAIDDEFGITQFQFHVPPATSFLRLHSINNFGDDLSSFRFTVLSANNEKRAIAGLEMGRGGLGMRGVVPVYYNNTHVGTVEFGLNVDKKLLEQVKTDFGDDWQIILLRSVAEIATLDSTAANTIPGPTPDTILQASTRETPIFAPSTVYADAQIGLTTISHITNNGQEYAIISTPLHDYSGQIIGMLDVVHNRTASSAAARLVFAYLGIATLIALSLGAAGFTYFTRRVLEPIGTLTRSAKKIASGDVELSIEIKSPDEIGQLATAFNSMTKKLREMISGLEAMVSDRTNALESASLQMERRASYLQAVSDVARSIASIQDMQYLLPEVVRLISERFGYYHVGIFLVEENAEYAELSAASSVGGAHMLARHHRLRIGAEGIVGSVAAFGKAKIALDVGKDATYFNNPDLPDTHSEIALPLMIAARIIGVLDVQSTESGAFTIDDIDVLGTLANQIAVAIENTRLFAQTRQALSEAEFANREFVAKEWTRFSSQMDKLGYRLDGATPEPITSAIELTELKDAVSTGQKISTPQTLAIPVKLRGEIIGVIGLKAKDGNREWSEYDLMIAQAAADRVSLALENARLLDDTRKRATIERITSTISGKISSSIRFETIMRTAAEEISRALNGSDVLVQLQKNQVEEDDQTSEKS